MAVEFDGPLQVGVGTNTAASNAIQLVTGDKTNPTTQVQIVPVANAAAANVLTISNASYGQATTLTIPDAGAASANILLSSGTANNLTDCQLCLGLTNKIATSAGTWTVTRIAAGDYSLRHTAAAETVILSMDITEQIRTTASKGLKLTGIDVISKVATIALTSATPTLSQVSYANNVANAVTSVPVTGSLSVAVQTNPYVDTLSVTTPAFLNTADSKYVLEISYVFQLTTAFDFYGINLKFTRTVA